MATRRQFIAGITAAVCVSPMVSYSDAWSAKKKVKSMGFISGLIGKELKEDWRRALKKAAAMGYTEMETGAHMGDSVQQFLDYCREVGIKVVGGGIKMSRDADEMSKKLDELIALKVGYAVAYWPWFVGAPFSLENCKESAEALNKIGEACRQRGLGFCWHNHDKEFHAMESGLPFDYLMNNTDPALVKCEMDVYWVRKGKADPVEMLKKYKGRYLALHIKDMTGDGTEDFACPGQGAMNFRDIFAEADRQGIKHFLVERDKSEDGMGCLQVSSEYLKKLRF